MKEAEADPMNKQITNNIESTNENADIIKRDQFIKSTKKIIKKTKKSFLEKFLFFRSAIAATSVIA